ncbi:olfactory receptor 1086-like [Protopterus annectens]|uniref:olfactory receptor 1086-like n=1 Tax=Protopterus annectens TaxID=7888 RepID=UPI001CF9581C|nr:olfactory receptor 1086-like [Protopterus annectens]
MVGGQVGVTGEIIFLGCDAELELPGHSQAFLSRIMMTAKKAIAGEWRSRLMLTLLEVTKLSVQNMENFSVFILKEFESIGDYKYLHFVCSLIFYLLIVFVNVFLVCVIIHEDSLHETMYIFMCNLFLNGLYGSTAFFPKYMADILSEYRIISYTGCFIQMLLIYTFGYNEITFLVLMAYDRYVSIYNPLRYSIIMTVDKAFRLILASWLYKFCLVLLYIYPITRICGSTIQDICCATISVLKLSCNDASFNIVLESCTIIRTAVMSPQIKENQVEWEASDYLLHEESLEPSVGNQCKSSIGVGTARKEAGNSGNSDAFSVLD